MANQTPEFLDSKKVFAGRVFDVTVDTVREADKTYTREVVHHRGSAVILPAFDDGSIALVRQYRHPAVRYLLELPAGTLNDQEPPEEGAARELEEELGLVAGPARWKSCASFMFRRVFAKKRCGCISRPILLRLRSAWKMMN